MITKEQLLDVGRIKRLNKGQVEKDYLIDIALLSLTSNSRDELVFKGGTCLNRVYNLDRFSEDLDFTQTKDIDLTKLSDNLLQDLNYFNIEATVRQKKVHNSITARFRIKGPLYTGDDKSQTTIRVDVNTKSTVIVKPETKRVSSLYPDVPSIHILVMHPREILAEKIRALSTRAKPRDLYDIYYLLGKNVAVDKKLIHEKLDYYGDSMDSVNIGESIKALEKQWDREMKTLVRDPPAYGDVSASVLRKLRNELSEG